MITIHLKLVGLSKRIGRSLSAQTHTVFNQSDSLINFNLSSSDPAFRRAFEAFTPSENKDQGWKILENYGDFCGRDHVIELAELAERHKPTLKQFDPFGRRIDVIDYHPSYHALMKAGLSIGAASYGFNNSDYLTRAGLIYFQNQVEPGHCCPIVMTAASIPVLRNCKIPQVDEWLKKAKFQDYNPANQPIEDKTAITIGMSMTEKQGGSDVRANTTIGIPINSSQIGKGYGYKLRGHKWFTSAPMSDGFLTLAKLDINEPPSLFLVPRWCPDGNRNTGFRIMQLKDKCGDRANASSEIEYDDAWAMLISEPGKGVKSIIDMVASTRLDCCLGSAGTSRRALQHVLNHTRKRSAFGSVLVNQPLMENLLIDLCIEAEAHTLTAFRMAAAFDRSERLRDEVEMEFFRIGVSVAKYYITKRQPQFAYECMEVFGGNGFAESFPMAKIFRHSPLNSIWEGSGNVIALDVLRGMKSIKVLMDEIGTTRGMDRTFDNYWTNLGKLLRDLSVDPLGLQSQRTARLLSDRLAIALQASLLLRYGNPLVAQGYISSRIYNQNDYTGYGLNYGSHIYPSEWSQNILQDNMIAFTSDTNN